MSFFEELKRRNVVRVGIAYAVASWIILQATDVIGEILDLPQWGGKLILLMLGVGFLLALFFAWAYELTPEGLKREKDVDRSQSIAPRTGRKLDFSIIALLAVGLVYFIYEARFMERGPGAEETSPAATVPEPASEGATAAAPLPAMPPPAAATDARTSIVVLPFVNMSADPEQEYFSDGLSEEILNALAQIEGLRVISRTSAFAFKGKDVAIPEIARQLDVSHVLEGSVRTAGDDVRITAQLIEVDTDSHLWSQAFSRKLENVFDIQLEISEAIANELQLRLSSDQAAERPTSNMAAYEAYLRGRHRYQIRGDRDMEAAVALFEQAVALDPEFDEAWANLAAAQAINSFYAKEGHREIAAQARESANRAITVNPANGFGHAVLGLLAMGDFDFERAMSQSDRALRLNPNESNSYLWKAIALINLGYNREAVEVLDTAVRLDPVFANLHNWLVSAHLSIGNLEEAKRHESRFREINPTDILNNVGFLEIFAGDF
ncbi:MAG: tetratricopeptide repeat protein, partial [Gammaproteobacteria bacterium]